MGVVKLEQICFVRLYGWQVHEFEDLGSLVEFMNALYDRSELISWMGCLIWKA